MNKTDRLLAIVLELQGRGRQRAEDLAETFETSKRTIYRDIQALCEAGVPVVSTPGLGYSLMDGYFLPPLHFTSDEAILLLLGSDFMARNFDAQYRRAANMASSKIENVLPEKQRQEVARLKQGIHFIDSKSDSSIEKELLQPLRRAILERITVRFIYHTRNTTEQVSRNLREADPYSLIYFSNSWHLTAYCHLRQAVRNFRLERMEQLELLQKTFQRPAPLAMSGRAHEREGQILVRALFDVKIARWVRESPSFFTVGQEETPSGLLVTLRIRREEEILQWLMGWGACVRVLEPASLRRRVAEEAQAVLRNHQDL